MPKTTRSDRKKSAKTTGRIILVIGGAASGKSDGALRLVGTKKPKAFLATGQGLDDEMAARIAHHQATRGSDWTTVEVPTGLAAWLRKHGKLYRGIVLDCVTLWLNNLQENRVSNTAMGKKVDELLAAMRRTHARVVVVSNELGLGLVPMSKSARRFRDLAGRVNQQIATAADEVYLVVSGMPLRLK